MDLLSIGIVSLGLMYLGIMELSKEMTIEDYMRHTICTGQTGTGKSVFARNTILKQIKWGGCLFIDMHGTDSEELLNEIPDQDKDRVIYINPQDLDLPIGINMYSDIKSELQNELSVNQILSIFENLFSGFIGPSTEDLIRMSSLSVVEQEISTLLETYLMLTNEQYRSGIEVKNEVARDFWENIFPDFKPQVLNPPLNKMRALIAPTVHKLVLCQSKPKLDLLKAMDQGKIIICNFNQGLGDRTSQLLAAIIVSKIQLLAFTRSAKSTPFFLALDEFQNYVIKSFAKILSEARKFNLSINLYHQYNFQVPDWLQHAIAGNCGSRYVFRIGELDAPYLERFMDTYKAADLINLPNYTYIAKRLIGGKKETKSHTFRAPKPPKKYGNADYIKQRSRELYGIPRHIIEADIKQRMQPKKPGNTNEGVF
jgi:DNA helicase HerA-like ATPase